jgi:Domain of unknown function (DUF4386)
VTIVTGILLIVVPIAFNLFFFALQRSFEYPAILRKPTGEILQRFTAGGMRLRAIWYGFAFTALLFIPIPVLVQQLFPTAPWYLPAATAIGIVAGVLQLIGLMRWPFLVPVLANVWKDPDATPAHKDAAEVVFEAAHRFIGGGLGEHLGYLLTAVWTILIGIAIIQTHIVSAWLAGLGIVAAIGILIGVLEEANVKWAGLVNAIAYVVWSIWLLALGVRVLFLHM